MTYALLCLPLPRASPRRSRSPPPAPASAPNGAAGGSPRASSAVVLLVLTAVFDSVMIAAGLFGYADGTRLGPAIGLAPIEDFAYPVAAVLLVPAVWTLARRPAREGPA